jgi:hypothetical protein
LHALGDIDQQVGTSGIGAETPDLPSVRNVPSVLIGHNPSTCLEIVTGRDLAVLDSDRELLIDWLGLEVQTVVLVLGLGEGDDGGLGLDSLAVTDHRVRNLEGNTGVIFLEILK